MSKDAKATLAPEFWFTDEDESSAATKLTETARELEKQSAERRAWSAVFWRLSTGRSPHHSYHYAMSAEGAVQVSDVDFRPPSFNALAAVIETLGAGIGKNKPAILFETEHADFETRIKARKATSWVWKLFNELGVYDVGQQCFDTHLRLGVAGGKVVFDPDDNDALGFEYVHPDEVLVDRQEVAMQPNGLPMTLYHRPFVDRERLCLRYPDKADEIRTAGGDVKRGVLRRAGQTSQYVAVVEGWHLPYADQPGRHMIAVGNCCLVDEEWKHDFFPIVFLRNEELPGEFFPPGIVEQGYQLQAHLDKLNDTIEKAFNLVGQPWVLVDERAEVDVSALGNDIGQIVRWSSASGAQPPTVVTHSPVASELLTERRSLVADIFKRFGVSDMLASGQKPAGVQAAEALRTLSDQANMRQVRRGQRLEAFYGEIARVMLKMAREKSPTVELGGYGKLRWKDVDPGEKAKMRPCPLSSLPMEPAGIIARADEWYQRGLITSEVYASIVDFPDAGRAEDDLRAARENCEWTLDKMIEMGVYRAPEKYQQMDLAIKMTQNRILREETQDTPEDRLDLLRQYLDECQALKDSMQPAAPQPSPATPAPGVKDPNQAFGAAAG